MKNLLFLLFLIAPRAFAGSVFNVHAFNAVTAGSSHNSSAIDIGLLRYMSFQCVWASLTGSVDATVKLQASNDAGVDWTDKLSAVLALAGASSSGEVSLVNATEQLYRLVYTANSVNGGTLDCWVAAK